MKGAQETDLRMHKALLVLALAIRPAAGCCVGQNSGLIGQLPGKDMTVQKVEGQSTPSPPATFFYAWQTLTGASECPWGKERGGEGSSTEPASTRQPRLPYLAVSLEGSHAKLL